MTALGNQSASEENMRIKSCSGSFCDGIRSIIMYWSHVNTSVLPFHILTVSIIRRERWPMVSPIMSAGNPKNKDELVSLERQHKNLVDKKGQLEEEVDLLKCESNSRSLWLKNMLEMDRGAIARIKDMQNNAEQDLKLMTGKLKLAEVEAVELSEKLKEKEIPKI